MFAPRAIRRQQQPAKPAGAPAAGGVSAPPQEHDESTESGSLKRKSRWDHSGPSGVPKVSSSVTAASAARSSGASEPAAAATAQVPQVDHGLAGRAQHTTIDENSTASQRDAADLIETKRRHREAILAKLQKAKAHGAAAGAAAVGATDSASSMDKVETEPGTDATAGPDATESANTATGLSASGSAAQDELDVEPVVTAPRDPYDMFGDSGAAPAPKVAPQNAISAGSRRDAGIKTPIKMLAEDVVDKEGYYHVQPGEVMKERYRVVSEIGRGVFSCVIACIDLQKDGRNVAMKVIKNNETMNKAALKEIEILIKLKKDDPSGRKHCVTMQEHFQHSDHAIMVFPRYDMNLRQVLKKYGRGVGIKLDALRVYAAQLLTSLRQLRHLGIVHADIKPDNILVTADKRKVVLADFGSAGDVKECEITPYLVSRYYRAPEISLGHQYDCAIDVWAIAATLYEMYTGEFMFKGHDNNEMLRMIQDIRGAFSHKMLRRSTLRETHFDDDFTFLAHPTKTEKKMKKIKYTKPTKDLFAILCPASTQKKMSTLDIKRVQWFKDLLDKMLVLDPHKRSTADHALNHPFFANY